MEELLKLLGFTTPLIYATAAYGLFHWLDENASDEAKAALAQNHEVKRLQERADRVSVGRSIRSDIHVSAVALAAILSVVAVYDRSFGNFCIRDTPAVIRDEEADDFIAQVIENQQRSNLSNAELAPVIAKLSADGYTKQQIQDICNLSEHAVRAFRQVDQFPVELSTRLTNADIRALYELFRQWSKTPAEVIAALPDPNTFITITEARRIIGAITGKPMGSIVLDHTPAPNPTSALPAAPKDVSHNQHPYRSTETNDTADTDFTPHTPMPTATVQPAWAQDTSPQDVSTPLSPPERPLPTETPTSVPQPSPDTLRQPALVTPTLQSHSALAGVAAVGQQTENNSHSTPPRTEPHTIKPPISPSTPTFVVHHRGRHGRLIVNRRSDRQNHALVQFETGIEPIALNDFELVRID